MVKICQFLRLTAKYLALLRLTVNPIETLNCDVLRGGPLFFWRGDMGNFLLQTFFFKHIRLRKHFFPTSSSCKQFFFRLQTIYFVFSDPANNFFHYFSYLPSRKIMVHPLPRHLMLSIPVANLKESETSLDVLCLLHSSLS